MNQNEVNRIFNQFESAAKMAKKILIKKRHERFYESTRLTRPQAQQTAVNRGPRALAHADIAAQTVEIAACELRRRDDVVHHRPGHVPALFAAARAAVRTVQLLAAQQPRARSQLRVERSVAPQRRAAQPMFPPPGIRPRGKGRGVGPRSIPGWRSAVQ